MKNAFNVAALIIVTTLAFSLTEIGRAETPLSVDGQSPRPQSGSSEPPTSREQITQGKALYEGRARCVHCHGRNAMRRPITKQELFSIIKFGVPGTSHIPFTHLLSDEEIWSIVYFQLNDNCMNPCEE
ncbi:c-type cytochrome [Candidatus Nitronereus thalassa]|uniref:c-type cytochrome n=1 Tax=Candidatus Nitronereus thalassa TaxID=3020898 RepID=UPI003B969DC7